jgi:hypothetical protein
LRAKLEVGPEGTIAVPPRQAEALGLSGGGAVHFVSARGACALVVPAREDAPRAWFAGSLGALNFPEIVQFVFQSLKTGVLLMSFGPPDAPPADRPEALRRKSIFFKDGQVVFASSSDPDDRLGPVLARGGFVSEEDLERCSRLVRSGRPLGRVLVDEKILDAGQLYEGITAQVKGIFLSCFLEAVGEFAFIEGSTDEQSQVKLPERTRDLILQGMKLLEEQELRRAEAEVAAGEPPPEIVVEVEVETATPAPGAKPREQVPRASGPFETYRRIFKRVHGALAALEEDAAARLNTWFDRLPENRRAIFQDVRMADDGDIDVAAILMNVNSSGSYRGAAARARSLEALEEFLAFALFEAKNRLPRAEAERLLREVGKMQVGKA